MKIDQHENLIRRYLLGELAGADQTALEQKLLIDRGKFDQVWAVENELVDSYVRGEMSRPARERFEGHYLASPLHRERVAIAEAFLADIDLAGGSGNATKAAQALSCGEGENLKSYNHLSYDEKAENKGGGMINPTWNEVATLAGVIGRTPEGTKGFV